MEELNKIMRLEFRISQVLAMTGNKENIITSIFRQRIKVLTDMMNE